MYGAEFLACGRINVFGYVAVGKLYAQGVVVQAVVDGGDVARAAHRERAIGVIADVVCTTLTSVFLLQEI